MEVQKYIKRIEQIVETSQNTLEKYELILEIYTGFSGKIKFPENVKNIASTTFDRSLDICESFNAILKGIGVLLEDYYEDSITPIPVE